MCGNWFGFTEEMWRWKSGKFLKKKPKNYDQLGLLDLEIYISNPPWNKF